VDVEAAIESACQGRKSVVYTLTAYHWAITLRRAALKLGFVTGDEFDSWAQNLNR